MNKGKIEFENESEKFIDNDFISPVKKSITVNAKIKAVGKIKMPPIENPCEVCGSETDDYGCLGFDVHTRVLHKQMVEQIEHLQSELSRLRAENEQLKEIAFLSDGYLGIDCCEEHTKGLWKRLVDALHKSRDLYIDWKDVQPSGEKETK